MGLEYFFAFVMVAVGSAVSGMAAFGFSLVIVPPLLLVFDPATVTTLVIVLTLITRWVVLIDAWTNIRWSAVMVMFPTGVFGSFAGAYVLKHVEPSYIKFLAGSVVMLTSLLVLGGWRMPGSNTHASGPAAGFLSGFLNTATGMAAPPAVLLFSARDYATQVFRGSLTLFFYLISITGFIALINQNLVGRREMGISLAMLPAALIGTYFGQRLTRRISQQSFRRIVLVLLVATGSIGTLAAIRELG